jgi:two-component system OmpR family response regulator
MAVRQILIVDDEEVIRDLFSTILRSHGYSVTTARTAKEALEQSQASYHNLALLDINLPDMQGTDLLEKMRASNPDMILIMITGNPELDSAITAINYGADGYIRKPVSNADLVAFIEKKFRQQEDALALTDERVSEWLESRLSRLDLENSDGKSTV